MCLRLGFLLGYPFGERMEVDIEEDVYVESTMALFGALLVLISATPQTETKGLCPHPRVIQFPKLVY